MCENRVNFVDLPNDDIFTQNEKCLTDEEKLQLAAQNKRLVPSFKATQLEIQAQRHWDLFYKRNGTRFFKDRHWTTREFAELLQQSGGQQEHTRRLCEIGCGVGNLVFPLLEDASTSAQTFFYACDFSPRAIEYVRSHPLYNEARMLAFQCDITTEQVHEYIEEQSINICTLIFVLSAIHPNKFELVVRNLFKILQPGGLVLFRDYGRYDMAQLRFKPGHKISDNLYMRQDGTRSYYFSTNELQTLFESVGFETLSNEYVYRRTLNIQEGIDVPRIFLQAKFKKSI